MAPILTVWTSTSTKVAESSVAQYMRATDGSASTYDSVSIAGDTQPDILVKFKYAFNNLVKMTMADACLHIIAIVPLWEENAAEQLKLLTDTCASFQHNRTLHVIGLCAGLRRIFDSDYKKTEEDTDKTGIEKIRVSGKSLGFTFSYSLVDDYASNGAPIGFTANSLAHYLALFQKALIQDYYSILSPALISAHQGQNISIGLSTLAFDRDATARQLLGMSVLSALDKVGINKTGVDAQKAANTAETIIAGIDDRYPHLFEKQIRPLFKEKGLSEDKCAAEAPKILDDSIASLRSDILSLLKSDALTLPEKEAVLALILGRDNENIRGMQYNHEGMLLDDACTESINIYVEAFNLCCKDSHLLPVRGDFPALKKTEWNKETNEYEDSPENAEAMNPLADIKRLKQKILNSTAFIREKTEEVADLLKADRHRRNIEEIRNKWHRPKGDLADIRYKEQPLDDKYTPEPGLKPKASVDLRKFFSPIRNQMNLGSCSSFAATAMYEALMNRNGEDIDNVMSPAYLYYYSNILTGRPDSGSNYFEQLEVLGKHGICREDLYGYNVSNPSEKPSDEAVKEASRHRVLSAKQIPLVDEPDKTETIRRNHFLLTSALSEGYPVGISLKLYDNFGRTGAFIVHPDDSPEAKEDGWHAMVAVGYSEENNFYIVRNSWGTDFGDDGYCYIPSAYIEDPDFMDFACIITEITDTVAGTSNDIPSITANFAATESEIRIAAIRNVISKVKIELKNDQKLYAEYYKYYQRLVQQLTVPKVQDTIRMAAEVFQAANYVGVEDQKRMLEDSFVSRIKAFKKQLIRLIIILFCIAAVFGFIYWIYPNNIIGISSIISLGAGTIAWLGYKWNVKIHRRRLQEELDEVAVNARRHEIKLLETQITFHVAGMWLNRFHKLSNEIGNVYERLVSFNSTLRAWQTDYTACVDTLKKNEGEMFLTLDASPRLQSFFNSHKDEIVERIDLIDIFEGYRVAPDELDKYRENLNNSVTAAVNTLMSDFNMSEFLLGQPYPYLEPVNLQEEITTMLAVGQPSFRNMSVNNASVVRILMAGVEPGLELKWKSKITPNFPLQPLQLNLDDPTTIILLTLQPLPIGLTAQR